METNSREILLGFVNSTKYSWNVKQEDVEEVIQRAIETNDLDLLLWFVSNPPNDDMGTGWGPGALYHKLCRETVFPYLAENVNLTVAETVCSTLLEKYIGWKEYSDSAFQVLKKAGLLAVKPVCKIIESRYANINLWRDAVEFVRNIGEKEVVSSIIVGMKNTHPDWSSLNIDSAMAVGMQTLMALDVPNKGEVFYDLLSQDDKNMRKSVISALGQYGDEQAIQALKKRLGGLFKKPETVAYLRTQIGEAIEKINGRRQ